MITSLNDFKEYPTKIIGLCDDNFVELIEPIEKETIRRMEICSDIPLSFKECLKFFVYFFYIQSVRSKTVIVNGEHSTAPEMTNEYYTQQVVAWNEGSRLAMCHFNYLIKNCKFKSKIWYYG